MSETASAGAAAPAPSAPAPNATPAPAAKPDAQAPKAETSNPNPIPKHKVKVDGKEEEVTLEELMKGYSLGKAGHKRLQEAADKEKQVNAVLDAFKNDPKGAAARALKEFGNVELKDLAIELLAEEHRQLMEQERVKSLSPEARELEELRKYKAEQDKAAKNKEAEKRTTNIEQAKQRITSAVIETLEQFPEGYRRDNVLAAQAAELWATALENADALKAQGIEVTPQLVAQIIAQDFKKLSRAMAVAAKDEELSDYIDPTVKERLFKAMKAEAEKSAHPALTSQPQVRTPAERKDEPKKRLTQAQLLRRAYTDK